MRIFVGGLLGSVAVRSQGVVPSNPSPSTPLRMISEHVSYLAQPCRFDEQLTCRFMHTLLEILLPAYAMTRLPGTHTERWEVVCSRLPCCCTPPNLSPFPFPSRDPSSHKANQMAPADQAIQACDSRGLSYRANTSSILDSTLHLGLAVKV